VGGILWSKDQAAADKQATAELNKSGSEAHLVMTVFDKAAACEGAQFEFRLDEDLHLFADGKSVGKVKPLR
jgi:hypothetical protein